MERALKVVWYAVALLAASILMSGSYTEAQCVVGGPSAPSPCRSVDFSGILSRYYGYQADYVAAKAASKAQFESSKALCDSDYQACKASAGRDIASFRACVQTHNDCISAATTIFNDYNGLAEGDFQSLTVELSDQALSVCNSNRCCDGTTQCGLATLFSGCVCDLPCCPSQ